MTNQLLRPGAFLFGVIANSTIPNEIIKNANIFHL